MPTGTAAFIDETAKQDCGLIPAGIPPRYVAGPSNCGANVRNTIMFSQVSHLLHSRTCSHNEGDPSERLRTSAGLVPDPFTSQYPLSITWVCGCTSTVTTRKMFPQTPNRLTVAACPRSVSTRGSPTIRRAHGPPCARR
jgi:hypothetical protein